MCKLGIYLSNFDTECKYIISCDYTWETIWNLCMVINCAFISLFDYYRNNGSQLNFFKGYLELIINSCSKQWILIHRKWIDSVLESFIIMMISTWSTYVNFCTKKVLRCRLIIRQWFIGGACVLSLKPYLKTAINVFIGCTNPYRLEHWMKQTKCINMAKIIGGMGCWKCSKMDNLHQNIQITVCFCSGLISITQYYSGSTLPYYNLICSCSCQWIDLAKGKSYNPRGESKKGCTGTLTAHPMTTAQFATQLLQIHDIEPRENQQSIQQNLWWRLMQLSNKLILDYTAYTTGKIPD